MAQSTQATTEIRELIQRSEQARLELSQAHARFRHHFDLPGRVLDSIKAEPTKWAGGSVLVGLLTSRFFKPKKKPPEQVQTVKKERNLLLGALTLIIALAKPAAKIYATKLFNDYYVNRRGKSSLRRNRSGNSRPY
ncbi:MAG: hypothetical protein H7Y36_06530 [Armatimonadetes bacterium]|nr:hypothetical protein [Akkermansiaceae bacterium]